MLDMLKLVNWDYDTWDYEFNFTHLALSKYSLTITGQNSLNIGFDSEATHHFFTKIKKI